MLKITIMVIQTFKAKVIKRDDLTKDVLLLKLKIPDHFRFQAGQYVALRIDNGKEQKLRMYSICSPPSQQGFLDLCIKIVEGGFSALKLKSVKEGDEFEVKGPMGHFFFAEDSKNKEHFFIAVGTGVAPFHSMIKEYLPKIKDRRFTLLFGVKKKEDLFLHQEFLDLAKKYHHFDYQPTLSREKWAGLSGRVTENLPEDCSGKTFYICGLKEMVLDSEKILLSKGVRPENIKLERYS